MALSEPAEFEVLPIPRGQLTAARDYGIMRPAQLASNMVVAIAAQDDNEPFPGINGADASPVVRPDLITTVTRRILRVRGRGTTVRLVMRYDDALSAITDPVVRVFGRGSADDVWWRVLSNKAAANAVTITTDPTNDVQDGTYKYTTPHPDNQALDLDGCDDILIGVQTALSGTGDVTNSVLYAYLL